MNQQQNQNKTADGQSRVGEAEANLTDVLERCPFCGNTSAVRIVAASEDDYFDASNPESYAVFCDASRVYGKGPGGCGGSGGFKDTRAEAVLAWNKRSNLELRGQASPAGEAPSRTEG